MLITDITQKLSGVKRSQSGFIARCPAHDDGKQSLSIGESGGKVVLSCFASAFSLQECFEKLPRRSKEPEINH